MTYLQPIPAGAGLPWPQQALLLSVGPAAAGHKAHCHRRAAWSRLQSLRKTWCWSSRFSNASLLLAPAVLLVAPGWWHVC